MINPRTRKTAQKVKARAVFDLIAHAAWRTGDPGLIFLDEINRRNPTPFAGGIEATNPCGEDQKQHVELTREIARQFNSIYGNTFRLPRPVISELDARIMGLNEPMKKMSKSATKSGHAIFLLDPPEAIRRKVTGATTDSFREIRFDEKRPGDSESKKKRAYPGPPQSNPFLPLIHFHMAL